MRQLLFLVSLFCYLNVNGQATETLADFLGDNQEGICYFSGELATVGAATGAFVICMETGGAACPVALKLMECAENPLCTDLVSRVVQGSCEFLITKTENALRVYGKTSRENVNELKKVYKRLNTVSGMNWLMHYMQ